MILLWQKTAILSSDSFFSGLETKLLNSHLMKRMYLLNFFFSLYCKRLQMKQLFWCGDQPTVGINLQLVSHSWVFSLSLTAWPLTRKANCALENIYEPGREIGLRSVDKQGGDGGEEEKKKGENVKPTLR